MSFSGSASRQDEDLGEVHGEDRGQALSGQHPFPSRGRCNGTNQSAPLLKLNMRNRTHLIQVLSCVFLAGMVSLVNPLVIPYRGDNPVPDVTHKSLFALLGFDALVLLLIIIIVLKPSLVFSKIDLLRNQLMFVLKNRRVQYSILSMVPLGLLLFYFYYCVAGDGHFAMSDFPVFVIAIQSTIISGLLFFLSINVIISLGRGWIVSVFLIVYSGLLIADWLSVANGAGRLAPEMVGWVSSASIKSIMSYGLVLNVFAMLSMIAASVIAIYNLPYQRYKKNHLAVGIIVVAVVASVSPAHWFIRGISAALSPTDKRRWSINMRYEASASDPVLHLFSVIARNATKGYEIVGVDDFLVTKGAAFPILEGAPSAPKLHMKRIIFLMIESLSLNFSKKYNEKIPQTLTPFLDTLPDAASAVWTVSTPTAAGVATHFCSHPNAKGSITLGYPHSVVRLLRDNGWRTVLFGSAFENFDDGVRRFRGLGFTENYGAEWQSKNGNMGYVSNWGVCDRVTFDSIVHYLSFHRGERIFLAGLTVDTHLTVGRTEYHGLQYPDEPEWIRDDQAYPFLRSIFRLDYDLKLFVTKMSEARLLDEETVLIITADHSCPPFSILEKRLGLNESRFERIPWIVLSGGKLPAMSSQHLGSQLDTAPTIAYFAGIPPDPAWWGNALQQPTGDLPILSCDHDDVALLSPGRGNFQRIESPILARLARTFVYDNETKARAPAQ